MALTLLDVAKRTGSDSAVGLIEEVVTHAPEVATYPVRTINGTTFNTTKRTNYPQGGFRGANQGVTLGQSAFAQRLDQCFFFDAQMQVDEAVVNADGGEVGDLLGNEASGAISGAAISLGTQIYYGTSEDAKGFEGLLANVASANTVDATGTGGTRTGVYFVYEDIQGVHLVAGNNTSILMGSDTEWPKQKVTDGTGKTYTAYTNNASGYLGLAIGHKDSIVYVKNLTTAKPFTDSLAADAMALFPAHIMASGKVKCYMNRAARLQLQKSRSTVGVTKADASGGSFAPLPTEVQGIEIVVTDSITNGGNEAG